MKKKLLSMLLVLAMVLALLPAMGATASAEATPDLMIDYDTPDGAMYKDTTLIPGATWSKEANRLTLNGYNGGSIEFGSTSGATITIVLQGSNTINNSEMANAIAFTRPKAVLITGGGSLTINMPRGGYGIAFRNTEVYTNYVPKLSLDDKSTVTINMGSTSTGGAELHGIDMNVKNDSALTELSVGENACLNINLKHSSAHSQTRAIMTKGCLVINGELNITGECTASGEASPTAWGACVADNLEKSLIGENARINIDYPLGASNGNIENFKLAANNGAAIAYNEWSVDDDYATRDFYAVQEKRVYTGTFAGYQYIPDPVEVAPRLIITNPVVGETIGDSVDVGFDNGDPGPYLSLSDTVVWQEVREDGSPTSVSAGDIFKDGRTYQAIITIDTINTTRPVYMSYMIINGRMCFYNSRNNTCSREFGPLVSGMSFNDLADYDIAEGVMASAITSFSVADAVSGGTEPYSFSKVSGPTWLNVSKEGVISGTRPWSVAEATTAEIKVKDAINTQRSITINVGAGRDPRVSFDLHGIAEPIAPVSVEYDHVFNALPTAETVQADGYTLMGWKYNNAPFTSIRMTQDITLHADWLSAAFKGDMPNFTAVVTQPATVSLEQLENTGNLSMTLEEQVNSEWQEVRVLAYAGFSISNFKIDPQYSKVTKTYRVVVDDRLYSNAFTVTWGDSGEVLSFMDMEHFDIAEGTVGYPIMNFCLNYGSIYVTGGTRPYSFSMVSGPDWLSVEAKTGNVSGTRPWAIADATTAVFRVTDSAGTTRDISVNVGAVIDTIRPPELYPRAGSNFITDTLEVSITPDYNSTTYYTTDGSDPKTSPTRLSFSGAPGYIWLTLNNTATVKAYSVKTGYKDSPVVSASYTKVSSFTAPTADPPGGSVTSDSRVKLIFTMANSRIYYFMTTDGATPQTPTVSDGAMTGTEYKSWSEGGYSDNPGIELSYPVGTTVRIKARSCSYSNNSLVSPVAEFTYTIASTCLTLADAGSGLRLTVVNATGLLDNDCIFVARYDATGMLLEVERHFLGTLSTVGNNLIMTIAKPGAGEKVKVFLLKSGAYAPICSVVQWRAE